LDDPNEIFIRLEWDTKENATGFVESEELRKIMKKAGVITKHEIHFFEKIEDFSLLIVKVQCDSGRNSL